MIYRSTYSFIYFYKAHPFFRDIEVNLVSSRVVSLAPSHTGRNQKFAHWVFFPNLSIKNVRLCSRCTHMEHHILGVLQCCSSPLLHFSLLHFFFLCTVMTNLPQFSCSPWAAWSCLSCRLSTLNECFTGSFTQSDIVIQLDVCCFGFFFPLLTFQNGKISRQSQHLMQRDR